MSQNASLPKDVGLCDQCSARNSKHAKTCNSCSSPLPWALPKAGKERSMPNFGRGAATAPPAQAAPGAQRPQMAAPPSKVSPKIPDVGGALSSVDWGATLIAGFLAILIFVVSISCPLVGVGLYWYFKNEESWMRHPAAAALWLVLLGIILRVVAMGVLGAEAVNN